MRCSFSLGIIGLTLAAAACAAHEDLGDRSGTATGADAPGPPSAVPDASSSPTPSPEAGPPAASGKLVLFGGVSETGTALDDTWTWSGGAWTKETVTNGPPARSFAAGGSVGGSVVMFGGANGVSLSDTWTWNGTAWSEQKVSGPPARYKAAAAATAGSLVLFGGDDLNDTDTWSWNGSAWTSLPNANGPFQPLDWSATTYNGKALLVGNGGLVQFDGTSWNTLPSVTGGPNPDGGQSVTTLGANVVLFGGQGEDFNSLDQTWTWDGTNWTLRNAPGPSGRQNGAMASVNGTVVLFGGCTYGFGDNSTRCVDDTWIFDGTSWTQYTGPGPSARGGSFLTAE